MDNKFSKIQKEYDNFYKDLLRHGKLPLRDTGKGFWGNAISEEVFEAFKKLKLNKSKTFIDLGSGDGKVVLIASLFCKRAVGIEIDNELHKKALEIQNRLSIPNALFYNNDFFEHSILDFDFVFSYPDQPMARGLGKKFLNELNGKLIHYGHHFHPEQLNKEHSFTVNTGLFTVYSR
jgi:hypothetical protein|tara:strand:- start:1885 stop:2415 length:531 start_codon:yes stop_codon:yes gene_type:complete